MQTLFERYFKTLFELHEIDCWPDFCETLSSDQRCQFLNVINQINQCRFNEARLCFWDGAQIGVKLGSKIGSQMNDAIPYEDLEEAFLEEL